MKNKYLILFIIPLFLNCNDDTKTSTPKETETTEVDTLTDIDSIKVEVDLFDMHPTPEFESVDGMTDIIWTNIQYFNGIVGKEEIAIILTPNYVAGRYDGRSLFKDKDSTFKVYGVMNELQDSITITFSKDSKTIVTFIGNCNEDFTSISGISIKEKDTLNFQLKEQINTPEQIEIFKKLETDGKIYNTSNGIALKLGEISNEEYNSFTYSNSEGEGSDFGEYWINTANQIFFEDSIIIYINSILENTVETVFKDDYQPSGPDDYDSDKIEGQAYNITGSLIISVIKNGVVSKDTLNVNEEFNAETWLFQDHILLEDVNSSHYIIYKWNRNKEGFEKQQ